MSCDVGKVKERLENEQSCDVRRACDVGEAKEGWRMSCDAGEATEGLENEL